MLELDFGITKDRALIAKCKLLDDYRKAVGKSDLEVITEKDEVLVLDDDGSYFVFDNLMNFKYAYLRCVDSPPHGIRIEVSSKGLLDDIDRYLDVGLTTEYNILGRRVLWNSLLNVLLICNDNKILKAYGVDNISTVKTVFEENGYIALKLGTQVYLIDPKTFEIVKL